MVRLHEQLKFFVNYKISTDPAWQGLRIYLSGHEVGLVMMNFCISRILNSLQIPWLSTRDNIHRC